MPDPQKIAAYRTDNGKKVHIPAHWLDDPKLGKKFRKTPRQKAADNRTTTPAAGDNPQKEQ